MKSKMALDMTLTLTLGGIAIAAVTVPLSIKFSPQIKKAFSKTKNGDASTIQVGSIQGEKTAVISNTGNGNSFVTNSVIFQQPSSGKTKQLAAKREIQKAFKKFFFLYLGNEKTNGMLKHKPNLHPTIPNTFATHYEFNA